MNEIFLLILVGLAVVHILISIMDEILK